MTMHTSTDRLPARAPVSIQADRVPLEERMLTIPQTQQILPLGVTKLYGLIAERKLDARKVGKRTLITGSSIRDLIASLAQKAA